MDRAEPGKDGRFRRSTSSRSRMTSRRLSGCWGSRQP